MANELTVYRGDTKTITVPVLDSNGDAFNLTSYVMTMTCKSDLNLSDTDAIFQKTATISAPATGIGVIELTSTDTNHTPGNYFYDVKIKKSTTNKYTVVKSTLTILANVTRT
jgi:hypothetical protein